MKDVRWVGALSDKQIACVNDARGTKSGRSHLFIDSRTQEKAGKGSGLGLRGQQETAKGGAVELRWAAAVSNRKREMVEEELDGGS